MFIKKLEFVPGKPSQPSKMYAAKAAAYPSGAAFIALL